jgi:hypothetical protein
MLKMTLGLFSVLMVADSFAQSYRSCTVSYNRWGRAVQTCRTIRTQAPRRTNTNDAVVIGAITGATAGYLASTCAPEVVNGNLSATERALNELAMSENFAQAEKFQGIIAQINETEDTETKMGLYFTLVDVKDPTEIVQFIGARDEDLKAYAQVLEKNAELSSEQADLVVQKLVSTLKGGLR